MILCGRQMPPPVFLFYLISEWTLKIAVYGEKKISGIYTLTLSQQISLDINKS